MHLRYAPLNATVLSVQRIKRQLKHRQQPAAANDATDQPVQIVVKCLRILVREDIVPTDLQHNDAVTKLRGIDTTHDAA